MWVRQDRNFLISNNTGRIEITTLWELRCIALKMWRLCLPYGDGSIYVWDQCLFPLHIRCKNAKDINVCIHLSISNTVYHWKITRFLAIYDTTKWLILSIFFFLEIPPILLVYLYCYSSIYIVIQDENGCKNSSWNVKTCLTEKASHHSTS